MSAMTLLNFCVITFPKFLWLMIQNMTIKFCLKRNERKEVRVTSSETFFSSGLVHTWCSGEDLKYELELMAALNSVCHLKNRETTCSWNNWKQKAAGGNRHTVMFAQHLAPKSHTQPTSQRAAGAKWIIPGSQCKNISWDTSICVGSWNGNTNQKNILALTKTDKINFIQTTVMEVSIYN